MLKIIEIKTIDRYSIVCKFNNEEIKKIDLDQALSAADKYAHKIMSPDIFRQVKIGELGQLYWENVAEMKDLNGHMISCEYDLSPEFVYYNSKEVDQTLTISA